MNPLNSLRQAIRKAPSIEAVLRLSRQHAHDHGDLEPRDALRFARRLGYRKETTLQVVDALMSCHGVESFQSKGQYWDYVNTGDTYACTVLLSPGGKFFVESFGDRLERPSHWNHAHRHD